MYLFILTWLTGLIVSSIPVVAERPLV